MSYATRKRSYSSKDTQTEKKIYEVPEKLKVCIYITYNFFGFYDSLHGKAFSTYPIVIFRILETCRGVGNYQRRWREVRRVYLMATFDGEGLASASVWRVHQTQWWSTGAARGQKRHHDDMWVSSKFTYYMLTHDKSFTKKYAQNK